MGSDNIRAIIKDLMHGVLKDEEERSLLKSSPVSEEMHFQWNEAPDMTRKDKVDSHSLWKSIKDETLNRVPAKKIRFYKIYSKVATVALLVSLAGSLYRFSSKEEAIPNYIVSSGIQNIQTLILPDGSTVLIGPNSTLTYPACFKDKNREVKLDGQAFFNVKKDNGKSFNVSTPTMDIQVLGTAFEVFTYSDEDNSEIILLDGQIKVNINSAIGEKDFILWPNEKIEYRLSERNARKTKVDADNYTAWRKRSKLSFENEKLSMIIPRLEQWYGRKIVCDKEIAEAYKFTFKVWDESLERILYIMGESSPVRHVKSEEGVFSLYLLH